MTFKFQLGTLNLYRATFLDGKWITDAASTISVKHFRLKLISEIIEMFGLPASPHSLRNLYFVTCFFFIFTRGALSHRGLLPTIFYVTYLRICLLICRENLPQKCSGNLSREFAVASCLEKLPWEFAEEICRGYFPWEFTMATCCGFFVYVSKSFFVYVSKSCLYGSKPFYMWAKLFYLWDWDFYFLFVLLSWQLWATV